MSVERRRKSERPDVCSGIQKWREGADLLESYESNHTSYKDAMQAREVKMTMLKVLESSR
jgi:hypothetical protein